MRSMFADAIGEDPRQLRDTTIEIVSFNHPRAACYTKAAAQVGIVD